MAVTAGHRARPYLTAQTGVAMVDQAMTNSGDGLRFYTADAAKDFWDPRVAPVVEVGGVAQSSGYTVNYLLGQVTFAAPPGAAVTVTGSYLPKFAEAAAKAMSMSGSRAMLDRTVYGDSSTRFVAGQLTTTATLTRLDPSLVEYTTGESLREALATGTPLGLEMRYNNALSFAWRAYVIVSSDNYNPDLTDLTTASINFAGVLWANDTRQLAIGDPRA